MPRQLMKIGSVAIVMILVFLWINRQGEEIDFNAQIKPLLNRDCMSCHGGVKSNGGLSFLFEEQAKGVMESGKKAINPGHAGQSELYKRLITHDPELRMPLDKAPLSEAEIDVFKTWIDQGAKWDDHWAYKKVKKPTLPVLAAGLNGESSGQNEMDIFIAGKLSSHGLSRSPEAEVSDLARRLSLDLTGLPPTLQQVDQLLADSSSDKWEKYVRELLQSPHYGEKWAAMWMDLARYSDTKGYERDDARTIWRYRDWLIKAFNQDKPYDQFLIEQIAGDLLPDPSDEQLLATAFHRNTMTNDEGGTDNEEFRVAAVIDRVNTTWETILGTSFSCVQCHSHPYDPIKHEDYYRFMAFFNNSRDEDTFSDYPVLRTFDSIQDEKLGKLEVWLQSNVEPQQQEEIIHFIKTWQPSINSLTSDQFINSELADTKWLVFRNNGSSRLRNIYLENSDRLIYRYRSFLPGGTLEIHLDDRDGPVIATVKIDDSKGKWSFNEIELPPVLGRHNLFFTYHNPNLKNPLDNGLMLDWFHFTKQFPVGENNQAKEFQELYWDLVTTETEQTPIMQENPLGWSRTTYVYDRGNWLTPTDSVTAGVPAFMNPIPLNQPANRLGLAYWLVDKENPLTARVFVNRIWEQIFGTGLVETLEDFGSQGTPPVNQELLDHLSWKLMNEFNWSLKSLLQYIVSSSTYRQSSQVTQKHLDIDPENKYLGRSPRTRLSAEQIRDQALMVGGLLNPELYGPSVMPFQPDRIWNSPYNGRKWVESSDGQQYRRALYTYWKRTSPYPSMLIFDMMAREVCSSRRINTNTPLQALVTLNDSVFVEAASAFAQCMIEKGGNTFDEQIKYGYKRMLFKDISSDKLDVLKNLYVNLNTSDQAVNSNSEEFSSEEHFRKMKIVANSMFNLDEFITKN